jgi:tetratricopeptide (TPR) repeat protein
MMVLGGASAAAQPAVEAERLERELSTVEAELDRVESANRVVPELFSVGDRDERATWGAIYHLNREYARASMALFGAVEPKPGEDVTKLEGTAEYAESLFFLADSLNELGNVGAARVYFERLLRLKGHSFYDDAIIRLMAIASNDGRFDDVDRYYSEYLSVAGTRVPGQVRYLRARSLFRAGRDESALQELGQIPTGEAFDLRARYLRTAILTGQAKLSDALGVVDDALKQEAVAPVDGDVLEYMQLARARLLYELDRLDESIDAYQEIGLDSRHLSSMLYEVSLTYVRRGQLALRPVEGDGMSDASRREKAGVEYRKALRQLDDLRSLDPNGERTVDIDLLAGSLVLQLRAFDDAEARFADVVARYKAADRELVRLANDETVREQILRDILALEQDPRAALESPLPAVAARRTARNADVARSLQVFKELKKTRAEVEEAEQLLEQLEAMLASTNRSRAEVFGALQPALGSSQSIANATAGVLARSLVLERKLARPSEQQQEQLKVLAAERTEVERRLQSLPQTADAVAERRRKHREGIQTIERSLHELELVNARLRSGAVATAWLAERELTAPGQREVARVEARQLAGEAAANDIRIEELTRAAEALRKTVMTAGGRGSGDEALRIRWQGLADAEHALLREARDPSLTAMFGRLDGIHERVSSLSRRNEAFRDRLDAAVDERVTGALVIIAAEREALNGYRAALDGVDSHAAELRSAATGVALERVRRDVAHIVLRGDVGIIDTAFARKQTETDQINGLQRARALELTDLTQAYADLTRDELP